MAQNWKSLLFETLELGVSSAVSPELLPDNQAAWGMNIDARGGKPSTRPNIANRLVLPPGLIQGCEYFGVQGGMLVASIKGRIWKIRINGNSFAVEQVALDFENSGIIKQVWMTQTVETLVIQDGQSNPILYNGSSARRANIGEVPRGRQMAYGNGRLWVAVDANNVLAGDIRTGAAGSELFFTEATYLSGGGKLFFTSDITGLAFIPVTGQSDYGALLVFSARETNAIRADITARNDWGKIPGFVTGILRSVGSAGQWPLVSINQDLYWRDSNGGIRSIRNALADEAGPGSAPISREVSRLTDYDSQQLLPFCSGVYFDNRLLMTSSPHVMTNGGVGWRDIIPLDFATLSSMGGKSQPAYDGKWNGLNFVKLVSGEFQGKNRAFALVTGPGGFNELWEFGTGNRADLYTDCGVSEEIIENRIKCYIEYPRRNFGFAKNRKLLDRCDVWLSSLNGEVGLKVYWRSDNSQKWLAWDEAETCAKTTDAATTTPHVWKNLLNQERPQFKTFTIPDTINEVVKYAANNGFEFQVRLEWTGRCRIHRMMLHAQVQDDPDYADRAGFEVACVENDVTGNDVGYVIPPTNCEWIGFYLNGGSALKPRTRLHLGTGGGPADYVFTVRNGSNNTAMYITITLAGCAGAFTITSAVSNPVPPGESRSFTIHYDDAFPCPDGSVVLMNGEEVFTIDDIDGDGEAEITVQPVDTCVESGVATFHVTAVHGPLEYDWFIQSGMDWIELEDNAVYSGVNTSTLSIVTSAGLNGKKYRCRVRNPNGGVTSSEVTLQVGGCGMESGCALFIPPFDIPYSDYSTAQAAIADLADNCIGYSPWNGSGRVLSATDDGTSLTLGMAYPGSAGDPGPFGGYDLWGCIAASAGDVITSTGSNNGGGSAQVTVMIIYASDGSTIGTFVGTSGAPAVSSALPASGTYIIKTYVTNPTFTFTISSNVVTSSGAFVTNPVIALWDDSGTTRQLEACPKLLLPPLTESTGELYADEAEAASNLSAKVVNCLVYDDGGPPLSVSRTAVGGASLQYDVTTSVPILAYTIWGSINAIEGETITVTPGLSKAALDIYDYSGEIVQSIPSTAGPVVSNPLPYTGRYTIKANDAAMGPSGMSSTTTITSSGAMSTNEAQALYESGVSCPNRLDC